MFTQQEKEILIQLVNQANHLPKDCTLITGLLEKLTLPEPTPEAND